MGWPKSSILGFPLATVLIIAVAGFGQEMPHSKAEIFVPGVISKDERIEFAASFTPDMKELYFSVRLAPRSWTIMHSRFDGGRWSDPVCAPFSGIWSDLESSVAPDGKRLFFSSNRPIGAGGAVGDFDIWFVEKTADGWSSPRHAGAAVNSDGDQWSPVAVARGDLYYSAQGVWRAKPLDGGYGEPERISDPFKPGPIIGGHAYVAPDESYMLTAWMDGPGHRGGWDMYVSFRRPDGGWTSSLNLGEAVNTAASEDFPRVSPDGRFLFFFRYAKDAAGRETGDIYRAPASLIADLKAQAQAPGR